MTSKELAIAIDTKMLAENGSGSSNPYFCAVPTGLTGQEVLELVYEQAIEQCVEDDSEEESFPFHYDYLWHGSVGSDGVVYGSECTEEYESIKSPSDNRLRGIVAAVKKKRAEDE
jgi:hypothetical protein